MITRINGIHLQVVRSKDVYQVFANLSLLPLDMEYQGKDRGWVFISNETPKQLKEIESQISDFITKEGVD